MCNRKYGRAPDQFDPPDRPNKAGQRQAGLTALGLPDHFKFGLIGTYQTCFGQN